MMHSTATHAALVSWGFPLLPEDWETLGSWDPGGEGGLARRTGATRSLRREMGRF